MSTIKHILRSQQFDRAFLERIFARAALLQGSGKSAPHREDLSLLLSGKWLMLLFYQPSLRTRISFEKAARSLGMQTVVTEDAKKFSSAAKGETLEHTIRILCESGFAAIVLRHEDVGASDRAAVAADRHGYDVSIINAGDGTGQHPTQSLIDVFTVWQHFGRLEDLTVAVGGDLLHSRTTHSLVYLLSKFPAIRFRFISPPEFSMKPEIIDHLREHDVPFSEGSSVPEALDGADVWYWVRSQREYHTDAHGGVRLEGFTITLETMRHCKEGAILLHPMPIVDEVAREVDEHPAAHYFRQSGNGIAVRMALLCELFGVEVPV